MKYVILTAVVCFMAGRFSVPKTQAPPVYLASWESEGKAMRDRFWSYQKENLVLQDTIDRMAMQQLTDAIHRKQDM